MRSLGVCLRTSFLALLSLSLMGGAIAADYYLRHEDTRRSKRFLVRQNIEVSVDGAVALAGAADIENLKLIKTAGIDLGQADARGVTPLLAALRGADEEVQNFLLQDESVLANVNQVTSPEEDSAMAHSLRKRDFPMAKRLLEAGSEINVEKHAGLPFLIDALDRKDGEMVDFLLEHKIDVNHRGTQLYSAAAVAAGRNDLVLLKRLVDAGANLDVIGDSGSPLLIEAVNQQDYEKVEFLLENGADVKLEDASSDRKGWTAVSIAVEQQDGGMIKRLFKAGADPDSESVAGGSLLYNAVSVGDIEFVNELLEYGASPDGYGANGETALAFAVEHEELDLVQTLLERGAKPDQKLKGAITPLMKSVEHGNIAIAKLLIESGAKVDGQLLLSKAYQNRDNPLMTLLLNAGVDPELTLPGTEDRIFDVAVSDGASSAVRTLLNAGAKIGDNLWAALLTRQDDLVQVILSGGSNPLQKGPNGEDPLDFVLRKQQYRAARLLLAAGASSNVLYSDNESWLAKSIRDNNPEIALALINAGAHVKGVRTRDRHTLLGWAIAYDMTKVAVALIEAGVDVMEYEKSSATSAFKEQFKKSSTFTYHLGYDSKIRPLHMAAVKGNHEVAQAIMDAGARGNTGTRKNLYPVNIGAWYGDTKMMQIILLGKSPEVQPRKVVIDLSRQRATLYKEGVAVYSTQVSTGKSGYRTPSGSYVISDKHRHHNSSIYDGASMPYFMRLSCSAFGLHQGYVPNYPASHGCIRVPYTGARKLFGQCSVGDLVIIQR